MNTIELCVRGGMVVVDGIDADRLAPFRWFVKQGHSTCYAYAKMVGRSVSMHRFILGYSGPDDVDHVNGNGLDNRRVNLRIATRAQNLANSRARPKRAAKSSAFKGVSWHDTKTGGCWRAEVEKRTDGKRKRFIRYASTEGEAARLYDELAREHFGAFARGNHHAA